MTKELKNKSENKDDDVTTPAAEGASEWSEPTANGVASAASEDELTAASAKEGASGLESLTEDEYAELLLRAAERDRLVNELKRVQADFENYQKRMRRERPSWEKQIIRRLLLELLSIQDNFERALGDESGKANQESFREGVIMIQQMLAKFFENNDTKPIEALGQPFDPQLHHAVQQIPTQDEHQDGVVLDELQKGYLHEEVVIRPTRVIVGKKMPAPTAASDEAADDAADTDPEG